jgi:hypothetical protein
MHESKKGAFGKELFWKRLLLEKAGFWKRMLLEKAVYLNDDKTHVDSLHCLTKTF